MVQFEGRSSCLDIVSKEPNEASVGEFGCWKMTFIVIELLSFLSMLKFGLKFDMNLLESGGEVFGRWVGASLGKLRLEVGVVSKVGVKWCCLCRCILVIVEGEFRQGEVIDPIVLLVQAVRAEVSLESLVGALRETVRLRVIGCGSADLDIQQLS